MDEKITIQASINAPIEKVWAMYNDPEHIMKWNTPSPDWHTVKAQNDLRVGGSFNSRMEAKDGSSGFDFAGIYDEVVENSVIKYTLDDGRKVEVTVSEENGHTSIDISFDPESQNPPEFQRAGWQAILDNFKSYVEGQV